MKHLLVLLSTLIIPLTVSANHTQHAEVALALLESAVDVLYQSSNFETAIQLTREAGSHLGAQLQQESDKGLRKLLLKAKRHTFRAELSLRTLNKASALDHLSEAIAGTSEYLDAAGGEELGLCCTRDNCQGCTLGLVTKDVCKDAGIYKTFRKHKESNPYPNPPEAGQCEVI